MGSEAVCTVRYGGQASEGKALLETSELLFRGDFRLRIRFSEMGAVESRDGELRVPYAGDLAVFQLGKDADAWAAKIRNPRGLLDKLGVKPGMAVAVLGLQDTAFKEQLKTRCTILNDPPGGSASIIFYAADRIADLSRLGELRARLEPAGAIWVVSPKGKGVEVKDTHVMAAAREAGLVDNKVVSFSATHTALRLVIPRALRK